MNEAWVDDPELKAANDHLTAMASAMGFQSQAWSTQHLGGVPWHEAPLPRRLHRCTPQTRDSGLRIVRCACGAVGRMVRWGRLSWESRNSRRRAVDAAAGGPLEGAAR